MLANKRKRARQSWVRAAKIQASGATRLRDCLILEISDSGVRLQAASGRITNRFTLLLAGGRRECRVIWRTGNEVGAEFVDTEVGTEFVEGSVVRQ
jgi:hypothetical protein